MPKSSSDVFRDYDLQVRDVRDIGLGSASDREIMDRAYSDGAIVVTRDKDFGDLVRYPEENHPGAVILRLPYTFTSEKINEQLDVFLSQVDVGDLENAITVLELGRFRRREL